MISSYIIVLIIRMLVIILKVVQIVYMKALKNIEGTEVFYLVKTFKSLAKEDGSHGSLLGDLWTIVCLGIKVIV